MIFAGASALCAILFDEPEKAAFLLKLGVEPKVITSPVAIWETVRAVLKQKRRSPEEARASVAALLAGARAELVPIGPAENEAALDAMVRYGKGFHEAALNMGDCFAYACARTRGAALLYKGGDFSKTDIERA